MKQSDDPLDINVWFKYIQSWVTSINKFIKLLLHVCLMLRRLVAQ